MTDLADLGPFFAVDVHHRSADPPPLWRPLSELLTDEVMRSRVMRVRAALAAGAPSGDVEERVAASVTHLGLVARIVAPWIGSRSLGDKPISRRVDDLWWQDQLGGPFPLSVTAGATDGGWRESAPAILTEAFARTFGVSDRVLWGNVASATNSAARMIRAARPELSSAAHGAADEILSHHEVESGELRAGASFRRRSCCLIYRVSGDVTAVCGDCVLG